MTIPTLFRGVEIIQEGEIGIPDTFFITNINDVLIGKLGREGGNSDEKPYCYPKDRCTECTSFELQPIVERSEQVLHAGIRFLSQSFLRKLCLVRRPW